MKNEKFNTLLLLTGIVAGASAVLFLKSKKGQEIIDIVIAKGEELKTTAIDHTQTLIAESNEIVSEIVDSSIDKLSSIKEDVKETVESQVSEFQQGVEKAAEQLNKA